mmetsp:Transcript_34311/g.83253  ORF Transcript_34311/g.83253 Transcript_34311/m.83253 type:complete len:96 (-) Transcript_34311:179-466(-)
MIRNTWQMAISHQKVNVHVLQELLHVASPELVHELVQSEKSNGSNDDAGHNDEGSDSSSSTTISAEIMKDPLQLIQILPTEWIDHGTPDQDPYQW